MYYTIVKNRMQTKSLNDYIEIQNQIVGTPAPKSDEVKSDHSEQVNIGLEIASRFKAKEEPTPAPQIPMAIPFY